MLTRLFARKRTDRVPEAPPARARILWLEFRCQRHPEAGGSTAFLMETASRWARDGHAVTLFTADPGREYAPERDERLNGVEIIRRGGRFSVYLRGAFHLIRHRRDYDHVVDCQNGMPFLAPLFGRAPVTLLIHHVHDQQWFHEFPYPLAWMGRAFEHHVIPRIYRRSRVMTVSPTSRDQILAIGYAPGQVSVVLSGLTHPAPAEDVVVTSRPARIAYVGRLRAYKRIDHLLRSVDSLRAEFPDLQLDIAGDGDARPGLERQVVSLGLQRHVTIHGYVDDTAKATILRAATVFGMPSSMEGWGLAVIEANAHACPAVGYRIEGLRDSVREGVTGLLVPDGDEVAFTAALRQVLTDRTLRDRLSESALAWSQRFSWDTTADEALSVLVSAQPTGWAPQPVSAMAEIR